MTKKSVAEAIYMAQIVEEMTRTMRHKVTLFENSQTLMEDIYFSIVPCLKILQILHSECEILDFEDFGNGICRPFGRVIGIMILKREIGFLNNPVALRGIIAKLATGYFDFDDGEPEHDILTETIEKVIG